MRSHNRCSSLWVRCRVDVYFCAHTGPWSDTNGRKLLILLPLIGQTLAVVVLIIALLIQDLPAEFLLLWYEPTVEIVNFHFEN